jgi:hypothetical protein
MPNTFNGVKIGRISQLTLDVLQAELLPLKAFVTDFSDEIKVKGETVTTRFVNAPTVQDFDTSKDAADQSTVSRTITLDKHRGVSMLFTDKELMFSDVKLVELYIKPAISAMVEDIVSLTLANLTFANFPAETVVAASAFDADGVADLSEAMTTAKVGRDGRSLIIKPTYFSSLVKDNAIQAAFAYGSADAVREHRIPRLHGFDVFDYNGTIPDNSETLVGVALRKQALCIAARAMQLPPEGTYFGQIQNLVEEVSGLPIQMRLFYDHDEGLKLRLATIFGSKEGVTGNAHRIVTVSNE